MAENRWTSELHWRRAGQQTRSERTQAALMDAAEELLMEKGAEATSIADIARRAGFSVGSVYHHFRDKRALLLALFNRMTESYAALTRQASDPAMWEGARIRDLFRGYLEVTLSLSRDHGAAKAAVSAAVADQPELAVHYAEIQGETRRALLGLVLARRDEIGHAAPEAAAGFAIDQLAAMLRARLDPVQKVSALRDMDDAAFVDEALQMVSDYLRLAPAGAG
ncbi:TetR family transcriptional regulator [Pseudooceanicola sp. 216_PA32_1]|uniref:TetR family transcriptional regulator n=1 Tax=Pseudooceanicola pacificus TaxID=2676438 RepID=A0A844WBP6_9RHOB|nr:TetR/AcrR family transcriptional regulator [Pseudooceanicola pacificus]MWB78623.1 TetR family transcriptional regulator [Pseudooceanicola pacificus]